MIMCCQIRLSGLGVGRERLEPVRDMPFEQGVAEAARARMHQQIGAVAIDAAARIEHLFHRLQLTEMIAAADCAERGIEIGRWQLVSYQLACDIAVIGLCDVAQPVGRLVDADAAGREIELIQCHAAAGVGADEGRMDLVGEDGAADRAELAGMQVRQAGDRAHARNVSDCFELAHSGALDPGAGCVEAVDRRTAVHAMGIAHVGTLER